MTPDTVTIDTAQARHDQGPRKLEGEPPMEQRDTVKEFVTPERFDALVDAAYCRDHAAALASELRLMEDTSKQVALQTAKALSILKGTRAHGGSDRRE